MKLTKIRQRFNNEQIRDEDIDNVIRSEYENAKLNINHGDKIAIAVGSRVPFKVAG